MESVILELIIFIKHVANCSPSNITKVVKLKNSRSKFYNAFEEFEPSPIIDDDDDDELPTMVSINNVYNNLFFNSPSKDSTIYEVAPMK